METESLVPVTMEFFMLKLEQEVGIETSRRGPLVYRS